MRLVTQNNSTSDLIPEEPDGMVDEEDIPILDSWTNRDGEDLWVLGDAVEQPGPVDLEFTPWHETASTDQHGYQSDGYHGYTDGSRRVSAALGWSLRAYNDKAKQVEVENKKGYLGEFHTAFDGEVESIANLMELVVDNEIPRDLTIYSDAQAAIAGVVHTGPERGQESTIRVVKVVQKRHNGDGAPKLSGYQATQGLQETSEQISLLGKQHPTSKRDKARLPGGKT
jgi:hypothetical protein